VQGRTALAIGAAGLVGLSALSLVYVATAVDGDDSPPPSEPTPPSARDDDVDFEIDFDLEAAIADAIDDAFGDAAVVMAGLEPAYVFHDEISRIALATGRSPRDADVVRETFALLQTRYPSAVLFEGPPVETATQADWEAAQWRFIVTNPLGPALCVEVSLDTGPVETSEQLLAIGCRAPGTLVE